MGSKVGYVHAINCIILLIYRETKETKKIRQNPEKWGCDSFR